MPWSRRRFLAAAGALTAVPSVARARSGDRRLVVVIAAGGWDVSYALDPKPGLSTVDGPEFPDGGAGESVRSWGELEIAVNEARRPAVSAYFDQWADRTAVINGIATGTLSHERSLSRVLSGSWDGRRPDVATLVGAADGARALGTVDLSGFGRFGEHAGRCARWGRQGQARALLDPDAHFAHPDLPDGGPWSAPEPGERAVVDAWLEQRAARMRASWPDARGVLQQWSDAKESAEELRNRRNPIGRGLPWGWAASHSGDVDLVVELLARDLCRSILVGTRQNWDSHARTDVQHDAWNRTFFALDRLLTGLESAGLLDDTTVLVVSEMSRTPRVNGQGGKDHWPWTSFLVAGGGVRGHTRLGGTDDLLRATPVDTESGRPWTGGAALEPAGVLAGVLEVVGVDPSRDFPGVVPCRGFQA